MLDAEYPPRSLWPSTMGSRVAFAKRCSRCLPLHEPVTLSQFHSWLPESVWAVQPPSLALKSKRTSARAAPLIESIVNIEAVIPAVKNMRFIEPPLSELRKRCLTWPPRPRADIFINGRVIVTQSTQFRCHSTIVTINHSLGVRTARALSRSVKVTDGFLRLFGPRVDTIRASGSAHVAVMDTEAPAVMWLPGGRVALAPSSQDLHGWPFRTHVSRACFAHHAGVG